MAASWPSVFVIVLLVVASLALGTAFNQSGWWPGPGGGGSATQTGNPNPPQTTRLVVKMDMIKPADWNITAFSVPPFDSMFMPMAYLPLTATLQTESRPRPNLLSTNSSGLATFLVTNGSYALQTSTSTFSLNIFVNVTKGHTTYVHVRVFPIFSRIETMVLASSDALATVEPSSRIYAKLNSSLNPFSSRVYPIQLGDFVQLVGPSYTNAEGVHVVSGKYRLNATALGVFSYPGATGTWLVLGVTPPPTTIPLSGMQIMVYVPSYRVSYAGL